MAVRRSANGERLIVESRAIFYITLSLFSQSEIAKQYNLGWSTIHNIVTNNTWKGI